MELLAKRAPGPLVLPNRPDFWGCFSWVDLDADPASTDLAWQKGIPAVPQHSFVLMQHRLRKQLALLKGLKILMNHEYSADMSSG